MWSRLTRSLRYWKVVILQNLVKCGISNMISAQQNYMNSSSRQKLKVTLIWTPIASKTTWKYLNAITRLWEILLLAYQFIKIHSEFEEYFFTDLSQPSYYWNEQTCTSLGHSLLVSLTNDTSVKSSMEPQAYNIVNIHDHEISGWTTLYRLIHVCVTHPEGINSDVQSDLATLTFKNR